MRYSISSAIIGNVLSMLLAPIVAAVYGVDVFGEGMAVLSIAIFLGGISCFGYSQAILVSNSNNDLSMLVVICLCVLTGFSFIVLVVVIFFYWSYEISVYYFSVPIIVSLTGLSAILSNVLVKLQKDKEYGLFNFQSSAFTPLLRLVFFGYPSISIFLITRVAALFFVLLFFVRTIKERVADLPSIYRSFKNCFNKYFSFFKYALPISVLHSLSLHFLVIYVFSAYGAAVAAYVALSARLINTILSSVGDVYRKYSISVYNKQCKYKVVKKYKVECVVLSIGFFIQFFFLDRFLGYFLDLMGDDWADGENIIKVAATYYYSMFAIFVLSYILVSSNKKSVILKIKTFSTVCLIVSMYCCLLIKANVLILFYVINLALIISLIMTVVFSFKEIIYEQKKHICSG